MNIFIYDAAAWDDKNSFGNTISNWFCGDEWKNDKFSNFYNRSYMPENKAVVNYYCLTPADVIKGFFKGKIKGKMFSSDELEALRLETQKEVEAERAMLDYIHHKNVRFMYWVDDILWVSKIWLNKYFKDFVHNEKPDVFFAFARKPASLWPIIAYFKERTACKIVLFVADDVKSYYSGFASWWQRKLLKECIEAADKLYAVSEEMSVVYSNYYGKPISTLYKGCNLNSRPKKKLSHPIHIVYAGNLSYGRDITLATIAESVKAINSEGKRVTFEIYSTATPTDDLQEKLNIQGSSYLMGGRPYDEIMELLHDSDIVLHVESFEKKSIDKVKYSLSTKIADYLQSGAFVLGIGPRGLASIEFLRKVDGAFVIDNANEIESELKRILLDERMILNRKMRTREYARTHQELVSTQRKLRNEIEALLE